MRWDGDRMRFSGSMLSEVETHVAAYQISTVLDDPVLSQNQIKSCRCLKLVEFMVVLITIKDQAHLNCCHALLPRIIGKGDLD